jgi:uncharacterized protein YggL (DUF469 family)
MKKVNLMVELTFNKNFTLSKHYEVVQKVMDALVDAVDHGNGLAPTGNSYTTAINILETDMNLNADYTF